MNSTGTGAYLKELLLSAQAKTGNNLRFSQLFFYSQEFCKHQKKTTGENPLLQFLTTTKKYPI